MMFYNVFVNWQFFQWCQFYVNCVVVWVVYCGWVIVIVIVGIEYLVIFVFIVWGYNDYFWYVVQVREIKSVLVSLIVSINNVCVVNGEQDWQFLNCYVMQYLIIGVLQESGVNCDNGFVFINCQIGGKGYCVLFGNCYVEVVIWEFM